MFPAAFPEDLEKTGSGEEYQLALIVQGSFGNQSWNKAVEELRRFLDLPRSGKGEHKARFYLGQCYYFTGKNREALFEFLAAQEQFPNEANPWLQAVLQRLAGKTE
jgi:TolA-binding protein